MEAEFGAWLARLEAREQARGRNPFVAGEPSAGKACVYRRDEVLVPQPSAEAVTDRAGRWVDSHEDLADAPVRRLRLRASLRVDVPGLVAELNSSLGDSGHTSPNHLLRGQPDYDGGPVGPPSVPAATEIPGSPPVAAPGRQVSVAVLDTGIADHAWFRDRPWYEPYADGHADDAVDLDGDHLRDSQAGHGTFIAGILLQRAPGATIVVDRLLSSDGTCDELDLVRHLSRLRNAALDIVNLSLGGYTWDDQPSPVVAAAVQELARRAVVIAAAGNNADDRPFWPAALDTVIAVGALAADASTRSRFSNFGPWVDAWAVGEGLCGAFISHDGPLPAADGSDPDRFEGFATWSGTSFAAPQVAGDVAARLLTDSEATPHEAADRVVSATSLA